MKQINLAIVYEEQKYQEVIRGVNRRPKLGHLKFFSIINIYEMVIIF